MTKSTSPDTNKVGYGRPPQHSRFKKGQSGNPSGKRKQQKTLAEAARHVLQKPVTVRVNGKTRKMSYLEAFLEKLAADTLSGTAQEKLAFIKMLGLEQFEEALKPEPVKAQRLRTKPVLIHPDKPENGEPPGSAGTAPPETRKEG